MELLASFSLTSSLIIAFPLPFHLETSSATCATSGDMANLHISVLCLEGTTNKAAGTRTDRCAVLVRRASQFRRSVATAALSERWLASVLERRSGNDGGDDEGDEDLEPHFVRREIKKTFSSIKLN